MNYCDESTENILNSSKRKTCPILIHQKIPRPPNAFMLYANKHRKTMAHLYPADSNKEISRRLGQTWNDLSIQEKNKYFQKAKDIDMEHKRKYPGYVYNPKDARMRKAIRTSLRDKSIGASPMLTKQSIRRENNTCNATELYQNLIMTNPLTQLESNSPMWNGLCDLTILSKSQGLFPVNDNNNYDSQYFTETLPNQTTTVNTSIGISSLSSLNTVNVNDNTRDSTLYENRVQVSTLETDFISSNSEEERTLYEREKTHLDAAENYMKILKQDKIEDNTYLPISATKFVKNPELFTNNAEYHKEYIIKYFNHIPDYETFNVTTEDGITFPYVTIQNLLVRPNLIGN